MKYICIFLLGWFTHFWPDKNNKKRFDKIFWAFSKDVSLADLFDGSESFVCTNKWNN